MKFDIPDRDRWIIDSIIRRWTMTTGQRNNLLELELDITACHANGNKLDLEALATASDEDFCHDVSGIRHHIDRETGKLTDCFLPRFIKR